MKKAFTLIELLVVIAILGILAGVLVSSFSGGTESARAATCLSNMRNLAAACQTYGMAKGHYPTAGSIETLKLTESNGNTKERYGEVPGWISWNSQGAYRQSPSTSIASSGWNVSMYNTDTETREYCITNGALWKYVSGNRKIYRCPTHVRKSADPNWSYVMNAYFCWTAQPGTDISDSGSVGVDYGSLKRADRILLFAEIPFAGYDGQTPPTSTGSGTECDCILQYKNCDGGSQNESISFNHKVGKYIYAHVAYADGHVEKLLYPSMSTSQLQDLTMWLCTGYKDPTASSKQPIDVTFDGKEYKAVEN